MSILTERDRAGVREQLAKLAGPVKLVVFSAQLGEGAEYAAENERLMREVAACAEGVSVEVLNLHLDRERAAAYGIERVPATVVEGARDHGIRFVGVPMGYEFTNLIDAMLVAASGQPALAAETLERVAQVRAPIHIRVFTTPT